MRDTVGIHQVDLALVDTHGEGFAHGEVHAVHISGIECAGGLVSFQPCGQTFERPGFLVCAAVVYHRYEFAILVGGVLGEDLFGGGDYPVDGVVVDGERPRDLVDGVAGIVADIAHGDVELTALDGGRLLVELDEDGALGGVEIEVDILHSG